MGFMDGLKKLTQPYDDDEDFFEGADQSFRPQPKAESKPAVSAALRSGVISGYSLGGAGVVFAPDRPVTAAEAAVMLDRAVGLTDAVTTWFGYDGAVPAWALQSASNVSSCGLLPQGVSFSDPTLSRGETAEMLCAAMDVLARRR